MNLRLSRRFKYKSKKSYSVLTGESFFKELQLRAPNEDTGFGQHLNKLSKKNIGHLILAHINISSIRYKFDQLVLGVKGKFDVLMITGTKLYDFFLTIQFKI